MIKLVLKCIDYTYITSYKQYWVLIIRGFLMWAGTYKLLFCSEIYINTQEINQEIKFINCTIN